MSFHHYYLDATNKIFSDKMILTAVNKKAQFGISNVNELDLHCEARLLSCKELKILMLPKNIHICLKDSNWCKITNQRQRR